MPHYKLVKYLDKFIVGSLMFMMFSSAISIAGSSIGLGLAFIGWITKIFVTDDIEFNLNPINKGILLFSFTILVSFIGSYNLEKSFGDLENYIQIFILYNIVITSISNLKQVKKLFRLGLISIVISCLYGLIWQYYYLGIERIDSTFMALDFGALIVIYLLFIIVYLLFEEKGFNDKLKYTLFFPLLLITLVYNKSRGAWLGFVGASSIIFWLRSKKWIIWLSLLIIVVVFFAPGAIKSRVASITDLEDNRSNLGRLALWKGAILMAKDYPINGIGLGNFKEVYMSDYKQPNTVANSHAHNTFLHLLSEAGIIGFLGLIYLLYSILEYLYNNYFKLQDNYYRLFVLATLGAVLGVFVIQGLTETNFDRSVVARTMWTIIGLATVIIENNNVKGENEVTLD
ncbi:O-antigen ligase family protein [Halanaerobaculum tunisiense]